MISKQLTHHRTDVRYDKDIGHLYISNMIMRRPYNDKPYFIKTNKQGFRANFDYEKKKNSKETRILFLGDSYTAGDGVVNERRFSDIVSERFGAKSYNFGLGASGVDQQYLIYKNIACQYEHDILVISPHIIDIFRNVASSRISFDHQTGKEYLIPKPYFVLENNQIILHNVPVPKVRKPVSWRKRPAIISRQVEYIKEMLHKYVPENLKKALPKIRSSAGLTDYEDENSHRWRLMRRLIEEIIKAAGNIPIILCPLPLHNIEDNPNYKERFLSLSEEIDNVFFVAILDKFKAVSNTDLLFYPRGGHYSEYGHQIVAEAIIDTIVSNNLLEPKREKPVKRPSGEKSGYILGISAFYHDSASAIVKDGEIIAAAQEERFTRIKNDSSFPYKAINYCLEEAGIHAEDLKGIVFYDHPYITLERILASQIMAYPKGLEVWNAMFPKWIQTKLHIPEIIRSELMYDEKVYFIEHHLSHAASAFYPSPFDEAAILTVDGVGEWATSIIGYGKNNKISLIKQMNYPNSVGFLYSAFTYYAGFKVNEDEYKLMGLTPYGEPAYVDLIKDKIVSIHKDGSISLNMKYFGFQDKLCMVNENFEKLFGGPARKKGEDITKRTANIAKSIQVVIEEIIIKMARYIKDLTGADCLCLAGGVALNCVVNGRLYRENIFKDIWIQPAAGDAGGALGAALELYYSKFSNNQKRDVRNDSIQKGSYLGPCYSRDEIKAHLDSYDYVYEELRPEERNKVIAKYLSEGKTIGHFSGRMEFGPRALGARSILGDARDEKAQSVLNQKIKFRESFRPFAPTVLEEDIADYFETDKPSPYMLLTHNVKKERCVHHSPPSDFDVIKIVNQKRSDLPAITHVDYSARIQSIHKDYHPVYYDLITEFKKITGCGVIINTSFNVNHEPIVCTPKDAASCFMNTELDVLILENFLLLKEKQNKKDKKDNNEIFRPARKMDNIYRERKKLQKESQKIFKKYFKNYKNFRITPLDNNSFTWNDYKSDIGIDCFDVNKKLDFKDIMEKWLFFSDTQKIELEPLLKEIIKLSNKYKIVTDEFSTYDSIYAMF